VKTPARIDQEIKAVAAAWNGNADAETDRDPSSRLNEIASAIYHTLRWARGLREQHPSVRLRKLFEPAKKAGRRDVSSPTQEEIRQFCATYGAQIKVREQVDGRWVDVPLAQLAEDRWEYHVGHFVRHGFLPHRSKTQGEAV